MPWMPQEIAACVKLSVNSISEMKEMKFKYVAAALAATLAFGIQAVDKSDYRLVWSDEFDGASLNRDYWNVEINGSGCGNAELQYYVDSPENVGLRDGNLVLTARRETYEGKDFTSGRINTQGKVAFTYGIVEARIKFPKTTNGLWPAFWMMGDDIRESGWPLCGETDILEMGHANGIAAGTQDRLFNGAMHWGRNEHDHHQAVGDKVNPYSLQDGRYHVFTVVWTADRMEMFVDDDAKPYLSVDLSDKDDKDKPGYYFQQANFILFNLAVGGNFPGIHSASGITALPKDGAAEMLVDYVRVYQKAGENLTLK